MRGEPPPAQNLHGAARTNPTWFSSKVRSRPWLWLSSSILSSNSCRAFSTDSISFSSSSMSAFRFLYCFCAFCSDFLAASSFLILCEVFSFALMY